MGLESNIVLSLSCLVNAYCCHSTYIDTFSMYISIYHILLYYTVILKLWCVTFDL